MPLRQLQFLSKVLPMKLNKPAVLRVVAAFAIVTIFTGGAHQIRKAGGGAPDFPCTTSAEKDVVISIGDGATGSDIAQQLFEAQVVKSSAAFFRVAVSDSRSGRIAPGSHRIQMNLCAKDALEQLLDPKRIANLISVIEGAWSTEIADAMVASGFSRGEVSKAMKSVELPPDFKTLEGLLFPAQYSFEEKTTAQSAVSSMIDRALLEISNSGIAAGSEKYSPQQLLIIASIIQAEGEPKDFGKVSQVIRNRLKIGMPLQMDSTVHFIQKLRGDIFLSTKSTLIKSDYNTYRKYGLPPGPIGNPGAEAMAAAVNPETGDWIYFITVAPGDTRFTASLDQFNVWKAEYKKNLRAGVFGSAK
jgi:UPF0755 protein